MDAGIFPTWFDVGRAFADGAREARLNPAAQEHHFRRAADAYVQLCLRTKCDAAGVSVPYSRGRPALLPEPPLDWSI